VQAAKNSGLRRNFLKVGIVHSFIKCALSEVDKISSKNIDLLEKVVKLLCVLSTVKTTRFYIPGETNNTDSLR